MTRYHTFWPRFGAGLLDGLVLLPVIIADWYLQSPGNPAAVIILGSAACSTVYVLYSVLAIAWWGRSVGKRAVGIIVLDVSEARIPTLGQSVVRHIFYILSSVGMVACLAYLVLNGTYTRDWNADVAAEPTLLDLGGMAVCGLILIDVLVLAANPQRRALHDLMAGTVVVRCDDAAADAEEEIPKWKQPGASTPPGKPQF